KLAHPILTALLVRKWGLPSHLARVALSLRDAEVTASSGVSETKIESYARIVRLADMTCHLAKIGSPAGHPVPREELERLVESLKLDQFGPSSVPTEALAARARQ